MFTMMEDILQIYLNIALNPPDFFLATGARPANFAFGIPFPASFFSSSLLLSSLLSLSLPLSSLASSSFLFAFAITVCMGFFFILAAISVKLVHLFSIVGPCFASGDCCERVVLFGDRSVVCDRYARWRIGSTGCDFCAEVWPPRE